MLCSLILSYKIGEEEEEEEEENILCVCLYIYSTLIRRKEKIDSELTK
jgi:hypothetical protein